MKKYSFVLYGASSDLSIAFLKNILNDAQYGTSDFYCITRNVKRLKSIFDSKRFHIMDELGFYKKSKLIKNKAIIILFTGKVFYDSFNKVTKKTLSNIFTVNVFKPILFLSDCLKNIKKIDKVIFLGSKAGLKIGHKYFSLYSASKVTFVGLFNSLQAEFIDIKFKIFSPEGFKSKIAKNSISTKNFKKKFESSILTDINKVARKLMKMIK